MKEIAEIVSIIEQYSKHDWVVRRITLSSGLVAALGAEMAVRHPDIKVEESHREAIWFSRRTLPDREAWELRRLSGSPFALVALLEDAWSQDDREQVLRDTEDRMFNEVHREPTSH
ncbi:MAG: hypothetical protein ABIR33_00670 [Pyrinomonadaceae bacterium]